MRPLVIVVDLLLWFVQGLVMLLLVVPMQRTAQLLTWASWKVIRYAYYSVVLLRRRICKRPMWSDSDLMLGIPAPRSEWERLGIVDVENLPEIK